jgi:hypothetical protein
MESTFFYGETFKPQVLSWRLWPLIRESLHKSGFRALIG